MTAVVAISKEAIRERRILEIGYVTSERKKDMSLLVGPYLYAFGVSGMVIIL